MSSTDRDTSPEPIAFIDLHAQYRRLKPDIDAAIARVLEDGRYVMGPAVAELEAALAERAGAAHAVTCASGTDALQIALMAEGIGPGDAVFIPSFTFTATAEVVALIGAAPVFVDVVEETYMIDPAQLAAQVARVAEEGRLVPRAVIAADLFGQAADYDALAPIAARWKMLLIDDAAQSFGGASGGRPVGALAPVTTTSFYPAKPLGCYGDGGAALHRRCGAGGPLAFDPPARHGRRQVRHRPPRPQQPLRHAAGGGPAGEAGSPGCGDRRARAGCRWYDSGLAGAVALPGRLPARRSTWAQYTIRLESRDSVQTALTAQAIPTAIHYPLPMHLQPAYRDWGEGPGSLPVSERLCRQVLCLPMHADLDEATALRIACAVRDAAGR